MKKTWFLLLILTLPTFFKLKSQSLISDSAVWYYSSAYIGAPQNSEFYKYNVEKDTLFKGVYAKQIQRKHFRYTGDTITISPFYIYGQNDTVYYYNEHYQMYIPLYDFTASINDTLTFLIPDTNGISQLSDSTFRILVDSIGFINANGDSLKAIYTSPLDSYTISGPSSNMPYIERIGSTDLMLPQYTTSITERDGPLRCYEDDSLFVSFWNKACDYRVISSLDELDKSESVFQIQPNPISNSATIVFKNVEVKELDLIDLKGRLVKPFSTKEQELNFSNVSNGVYFVRVTTANQEQFTQKVVVQK